MPSSSDNETWEKKNERNLVKNPFWLLCSIHEIFASLEHADVWRFTVITQQRSQLKLSIYSDPPALLFIVSKREKPFASVLLFIRRRFVVRCIRRHLCRFLLPCRR